MPHAIARATLGVIGFPAVIVLLSGVLNVVLADLRALRRSRDRIKARRLGAAPSDELNATAERAPR